MSGDDWSETTQLLFTGSHSLRSQYSGSRNFNEFTNAAQLCLEAVILQELSSAL